MGRALAVRVRELGLWGSLHRYDDINRIWIVDAIRTVKLVHRTGCSGETLSENPKGLHRLERRES